MECETCGSKLESKAIAVAFGTRDIFDFQQGQIDPAKLRYYCLGDTSPEKSPCCIKALFARRSAALCKVINTK